MSDKAALAIALLLPIAALADVDRRTLNNGNLVLEDVPEIPKQLAGELFRYQSVRSASFRAWTEDGKGIFIATGFGDVESIHRVDMPLGARRQITFYEEPVGAVSRQPGGRQMLFSRDAGGSELAQIFRFDPETGEAELLTDGASRNGAAVWDRGGRRVAFQSTRRNGASNDIWIMDPEEADQASVVLEASDGSWWGPTEFSANGGRLLANNYVSVSDSSIYTIDLDSGAFTLHAGGPDKRSVNYSVAFDDANDGFWLVTDQAGEFNQLAWQSNKAGSRPEIVTASIPWNVSDAVLSHDRSRMVFVTNENGTSRVYLMDAATREFKRVDSIPTGRAFDLTFSPDDRRLGMTLNTPQTPSDSFVLDLGAGPLDYGALTRWTMSEVGGLDTTAFRIPELVYYPTFDTVNDAPRQIPAWVYKPQGKGPHPVVIAIHGGPESQSRPTFSSTLQLWLDKLGVAVIQPNVRGSNGYGKTYLSLDNGFRRADSVKDIGALLDWIATQPDLDARRVAVFGGSYGGYMVLASAVHYSERLRAAVDIVGISNFVTFLENTRDYRRDLRRQEYGDEREPKMRAHLENISPANHAESISVPMFIVQGENDPRVPATEARQMVEALRREGHTVWYMNALNEGHGYKKRENRDIYQQATVMFFQEHLID